MVNIKKFLKERKNIMVFSWKEERAKQLQRLMRHIKIHEKQGNGNAAMEDKQKLEKLKKMIKDRDGPT